MLAETQKPAISAKQCHQISTEYRGERKKLKKFSNKLSVDHITKT